MFRYIFRPQLSVDANFRLSCKMRPSPRTDDPLYSGLGVQPSFEEYHAWLRSYITEEEVSRLGDLSSWADWFGSGIELYFVCSVDEQGYETVHGFALDGRHWGNICTPRNSHGIG